LNTDIDTRTGWPDELREFLNRFPRDSWRRQTSPMAQFWIDRHDWFRQECTTLQSAADDYRSSKKSAGEMATWVAPRLQTFLGSLHGHHQIEDYHYFPAFRESEKSLAPGFDVLAHDHELIHVGISDIVNKVNTLLATLRDDGAAGLDAQRHSADQYVDASETLYRRLVRHLDDEEDLIIPLMIDRG